MPQLIENIVAECWQTADDHGFHGVGRSFGDTCTLIHSEISEAYEAYRERGDFKGYTEVDGKPEGAPVELLDAVVRIFDTLVEECGLTPIHVAALLAQKMAYNKGRPFLHGKAF